MPLPARDPANERRFSPRHYFHGPIAVRLAHGQLIDARGIDIGANGVGLHCQVNLAPGTPCQLQFKLMLHDGSIHPVEVHGTVAHTTLSGDFGDFKVGVQLSGVQPPVREMLARYSSQ